MPLYGQHQWEVPRVRPHVHANSSTLSLSDGSEAPAAGGVGGSGAGSAGSGDGPQIIGGKLVHRTEQNNYRTLEQPAGAGVRGPPASGWRDGVVIASKGRGTGDERFDTHHNSSVGSLLAPGGE